MLIAATAVVAASAVGFGLPLLDGDRSGGDKSGGEIFLQAAGAPDRDPFTLSTAQEPMGVETPPAARAGPTADTNRTGYVQVTGAHPGLYGGTQSVASCDVEKQITFLTQNSDKGKAFAGALGVQQPEIPSYLRSLTPARLDWDTRVTNHGYKNGSAVGYQAVLQAGTAVLVDDRGVPRVRCACGNPLNPPVADPGTRTYRGPRWSSFQPTRLVAVTPAAAPMRTVTMYDPGRKAWFERPAGDLTGGKDRKISRPKDHTLGSPFPALPSPSPRSPEETVERSDSGKPTDSVKQSDSGKPLDTRTADTGKPTDKGRPTSADGQSPSDSQPPSDAHTPRQDQGLAPSSPPSGSLSETATPHGAATPGNSVTPRRQPGLAPSSPPSGSPPLSETSTPNETSTPSETPTPSDGPRQAGASTPSETPPQTGASPPSDPQPPKQPPSPAHPDTPTSARSPIDRKASTHTPTPTTHADPG